MSAQATQADGEPNGFDLDTMEPIVHEYDCVGETVLAECCVCTTPTDRRLLKRDYHDEEDFKQSLVAGDDDYFPASIWRRCEECGDVTTHFVC